MSSRVILTALFILIATGPPKFFDGGDLTAAFGSNVVFGPDYLIQIIAWALAGFGVALVATNEWMKRGGFRFPSNLRDGPARWYLFYAIVCVASATYSNAPLYTLFFASKILISILIVSYFLESSFSRTSGLSVLKIFGYVYGFGFLVLIAMYLYDPSGMGVYVGGNYRLHRGPLGGYGSEALVAGIFALVYFRHFSRTTIERTVVGVFYVLTWVFLLMSLTRTSIFIGLLAFIVIGVLGRMSLTRVGGIVLAVGMFGLVMSTGWLRDFAEHAFGYATRGMTGIETLSGRTVVGEYLLALWRDAPVLGHGYASGSRLALIEFVYSTGINMGSAHGSFWKALVEVGLVGASLMVAALLLFWQQTIRLLLRQSGHPHVELIGKVALIGVASATLSLFLHDGLADGQLAYIILMFYVAVVNRRLDLLKKQSVGYSPLNNKRLSDMKMIRTTRGV